jgi:hypothetical protein
VGRSQVKLPGNEVVDLEFIFSEEEQNLPGRHGDTENCIWIGSSHDIAGIARHREKAKNKFTAEARRTAKEIG